MEEQPSGIAGELRAAWLADAIGPKLDKTKAATAVKKGRKR